MNKSLHRIIFNKRRGHMMAVAETAGAHSGSGKTAATTPAVGLLLGTTLSGALTVVLGSTLSLCAQAQVVVNTAAPAAQQAQVTSTASGIPQVNITAPVGGVSRNRYTQFDVGSAGLVLNNSPANSNTRLAGWVAGNPNLPGGSASIILNEVNSANPTQLRGYIEVAGQRAEVIIANPSGIAVNGGGFINASGATLTTGTPQFSGNTLAGFQVTGGTITVSGAGLDASTIAATTLQAQRIMLQGGVWAQDLRLVGDNTAGTANAVAIDVSAIGGMYAGKITILATGQGAGVNNAGVVQANSGALTLSADGLLTNTGTIDSTATTRINAATVNNSTAGAIYGGSVAISANTLNNAAATPADTAPVIAARDATGRVDLGVQTLNNQEGALIYSAGSVNIGGALDANGQSAGRATTVTNNSATLEAAGNVAITTQTLANTYASLSYRTEVDPNTPAVPGSAPCGTDCSHSWVDTYYRAVAIEGPNGPAVIRSGADIALDASTSALNSSSQILAAGTLTSTGAALDSHGIDLTTQVATHRDHTVVQTWMENGIGCPWNCHSQRRWSYSYSTDLIARDQTIAPALAQSHTTSASTTAALPNSALFSTSANPAYLVQTDPRFTNRQVWLSSDYMLSLLTVDPDVTQKRMGDGYYEQRLINEQIAQLTGYARLANYSSDEAQYQALMSAGVTFAQAHQLRLGIALSAEQVAQLTSDMVWLVEREVTLADGSTQKVLAPQVYAVARAGDLSASGALLSGVISGNVLNLATTGDIANSNDATILGRELVTLSAANVRNLGARIQGATVQLNASQDIDNTGGAVIAQNSLLAAAGRDIKVQSTTQSSVSAGNTASTPQSSGGLGGLGGGIGGSFGGGGSAGLTAGLVTNSTDISRVAGLYVTAEAGILLASAGRDVQLSAALLQSAGTTKVNAERNITLDTVTTSASLDATMDAGNYNRTSQSAEVGTTLQSAGNTTLLAGGKLSARAADVQAAGTLTARAGTDLVIEAGTATRSEASSRVSTNSGFLSSSKRTAREASSTTTAIASNFGGQTITGSSGQDLTIRGSNVTADKDITLTAANNLTIEAATNLQTSSRYSALSESGLMNSGDAGVSFGQRDKSTDTTFYATSAAASTVGSVGGNVNLSAGNTYTQRGSDVLAAGQNTTEATDFNALVQNAPTAAGPSTGNVTITAKKVDIVEARETTASATEQKFSQSGITLALESSALQGAQTVQNMDQSMSKTKSSRMKALGAASAAMAARQAAQNPTFNVSLSAGTSSSTSNSTSASDTARGSSVGGAGNTTITATGAGHNSNVLIQGSTVNAGDTVTLSADNQVQLLAALNTETQTSSQKSSSASAGISLGSDTGVNVSASMGSGSGNGSDLYYTNTQVGAGKKAVITSGGDVTLAGAVVKAKTIEANVGKDLNIRSLQDTSRFNESSQNAGGSVTIGMGASGSISVAGTKIDSNYRSVNQQSALRAGDGGFNVNVAGNTDLKGGAITSTQKAIDDNKNTFSTAKLTTSDVQNSASFSAESYAVTIGSKGGSAGMGQDSGSAASTTKAAISGIAGNKAARTGDAETGIQKIFDANKTRDEVGAQVAITSEFGKQAPRVVAEYAKTQYDALTKAGKPEEAAKWAEGGTYRVLMHTTLGALAGGNTGTLGAGAIASTAPLMNEMQDKLAANLEKAGLSKDAAAAIGKTVAQTTALATGAALGGTSSGAMALNVDANNRQLHPTERQRITELAKGKAQEACRGNATCERQANLYWTDMLERAAEGRVDTQEAQKSQTYYQQVIQASGTPGTEAAMGAGVTFFNDLAAAQQLLNADTGKLIVDSRGNPVLGTDGKPQTYFSATQAQRDNAYGNVFPGGSPNTQSSVIPGKERRDEERLQRLTTPNGSTTPDTTIEEALLGMRVPTRAGGAAVQVTSKAEGAALAGTAIRSFKSADEINALMGAYNKAPAWRAGSQVAEVTMAPGTKVQMVVDKVAFDKIRNGEMDFVGNWASFDNIPNQTFARNNLAITREFKPDVGYVVELEITRPLNAQVGVVGPQGAATGGANQLNFLFEQRKGGEFFKFLDGKVLP